MKYYIILWNIFVKNCRNLRMIRKDKKFKDDKIHKKDREKNVWKRKFGWKLLKML